MSYPYTTQVDWKPISISIAELWALAREQRLVLRPDFQRRVVWSEKAQKSLIDTIVRNLPMPKVFFATETLSESKTLRRVIDGQQRLTAIFHFLEGRFRVSLNNSPLELFFEELTPEARNQILEYRIDGNDIFSVDDHLIREIYSRVNKYNIALNRQELRKADFPGHFLMEAEDLADLAFFEENRIFSAMQRRRMLDVEFTSELLLILLEGIQDKKDSLDLYCQKYQVWESESRRSTRHIFTSIIDQLYNVFKNCGVTLSKTRFRQKSDFYSLFSAFFELGTFTTKSDINWNPLTNDLQILDRFIAPESPIDLLSTYAVKCVSDANSISSRRWRTGLLKSILKPSIFGDPEAEDVARFAQIRLQLPENSNKHGFDSIIIEEGIAPKFDMFDPDNSEKYWVAWRREEYPMQMSNMVFISEGQFLAKEHKFQNSYSLKDLALNYFLNSDV